MSDESQNFPHVSEASAQEFLAFADEFHRAALVARKLCEPKKPLTRIGFCSLAIHAIELYLNAYLRNLEVSPAELKKISHNLRKRRLMAVAGGLKLRRKTQEHLDFMTVCREYRKVRYGPEIGSEKSELSQIDRTLREVAKKVGLALKID
jgi:hypothetical protein